MWDVFAVVTLEQSLYGVHILSQLDIVKMVLIIIVLHNGSCSCFVTPHSTANIYVWSKIFLTTMFSVSGDADVGPIHTPRAGVSLRSSLHVDA